MKPTVELQGAHAVVTGGARGIGLATARRLRAYGCNLTLWDRDARALDAAAAELRVAPWARTGGKRATSGFDTPDTSGTRGTSGTPDRPGTPGRPDTPGTAAPAGSMAAGSAPFVRTATLDITDSAQVDAAWAVAESAAPVDVLINNAGVLADGRFHEREFAAWSKTMAVNVEALMYLTHHALPGMYRRRKGHVVNISSASGAIAVPGLAVYSASKWAVWGFSEALRAEAREHNVLVSSIHPSYIAHGLFEGAKLAGIGNLIVPRLRDHDVVAKAIVEAALRRGQNRPMRPRSVRLAVLLRGILSDRAFQWTARALGVWDSMNGRRRPGAHSTPGHTGARTSQRPTHKE